MPELPEVETFRRYIERTSLERPIAKVEVKNLLIIRPMEAEAFVATVEGSKFLSTFRHGKQLFLEMGRGGWLTWHFGMTGEPVYFDGMYDEPRYDRLLFTFERGHLAFEDPRMLGRIGLTPSPEVFITERRLGPDALTVSRREFVQIMGRSRGPIKMVMMDQHKLAGVGNLYSDEALFQSRIDPRTPASSLGTGRLESLHGNVRKVLFRSVRVGGDLSRLPRSYLLRHRAKGESCPSCGGEVASIALGGRTSYLCPRCQDGGWE